MKGFFRAVVPIMFFIGLLVLNYPVMSTLYGRLHQEKELEQYDQAVEELETDSHIEEYRRQAQSYNAELAGKEQELQDAFSQKAEENVEYEKVLDMDQSGIMGSVEIPGIHAWLPVYHGTAEETLEKGVGHLEGSSFPVGGESTHAVLTGHRGLPAAELFTNLDQVKEGDDFFIHILNQTLAYRVYDIETVEPQQAESLTIMQGRDLVTLVTCTPYGINSHRLLIHGQRIPWQEPKEEAEPEKTREESLVQWLLTQKVFLASMAAAALLILYGLVSAIIFLRKK